MVRSGVRLILWVVVLLQIQASAHELLTGGMAVNPPLLEAERANAKLNFLTDQARRNGVDDSKINAAKSVYYDAYRWPKTELRVCFWNGTEELQREVMQIANTWHDAVPLITFDYLENGKIRLCNLNDLKEFKASVPKKLKLMQDIRITLSNDDNRQLYHPKDIESRLGDWAYPGRSVALNADFPTTMNLVGAIQLRQKNLLSDYYFNVRHEFGHALSLVHEHQRGICKNWFNIAEIAKSQGWSEKVAKEQVDSINESSNVYGFIGGYDPDSIMQYNFAVAWYAPDKPGQPNPCRRKKQVDDLSDLDKVVVAALYQPALNDTPERQALITKSKQAAAVLLAGLETPTAGRATSQTKSIETALADFETSMRKPTKITLQIYPHRVDKDIVFKVTSNLGYPLKNQEGKPIRTVSENTTASLREDRTNTLLYTADVSDQDVRYVALALVRAGIEIKSLQPYYPTARSNYAKRYNLIQIGADISNRGREPLSVQDILEKPLPLFAPKKAKP